MATWPCESGGWAKSIKIDLGEADRQALSAIVTDRNTLPRMLGRPQKHVWRVRISADRRWLRQHGTHLPHRHQQDRALAMAGAVPRGGRAGPAARQAPPLAHSTAFAGCASSCDCRHPGRTAGRDHALDFRRDGQAHRHQRQFRCSGSGARTDCSRTRRVCSSCPRIPGSPRSSLISSDSMLIRPPTPSSCRSTRRAKFRHLTEPNRAYR